jgi:hypothetical protein
MRQALDGWTAGRGVRRWKVAATGRARVVRCVRRERDLAARLSLPLSNTIQDLQQTQEPRQTPTRQKTDPAVSDAPQTVSPRWPDIVHRRILTVVFLPRGAIFSSENKRGS